MENLNENRFTPSMTRTRGYGHREEGLVIHKPYGHWKTTTFDGSWTTKRIFAPIFLDGAMNGDWFKACVEQVLVREAKPGDLLILDNLSSHKATQIRKAFEENRIYFLLFPS